MTLLTVDQKNDSLIDRSRTTKNVANFFKTFFNRITYKSLNLIQ